MPDRLNHVAGAGLALGADHRCAFPDAPEGLAQIAAAAYKRHLKIVLQDVVLFICRSQNLRLINVIDPDGFQNLRFHEMPDAALGHDRDADRVHDSEDQVGVRHAGHTALGADVCRDAFQRHDGACSGILGNFGMFGGDNVHDDAAFKHLSQSLFDGESTNLLFHDSLLDLLSDPILG